MIHKKHLLKSIFILCSAIGIVLFLPKVNENTNHIFGAVVINEVFPKTDDASQTWIELYNNGNDSVSLDRWSIENTFGTQQSFSLNASTIVPGKSFVILPQSQYGFTLNKEGDTLRLFDSSGTKVDEQSFFGIIGYYQSMGRSTDGEGIWTNCTNPTKNSSNNCIAPTPTATPIPTETPAPTMTPYPTNTPITASPVSANPTLPQTTSILPENSPLLPTITPPIATSSQPAFPIAIVVLVLIIIVWIIIIGIIMWKKKR